MAGFWSMRGNRPGCRPCQCREILFSFPSPACAIIPAAGVLSPRAHQAETRWPPDRTEQGRAGEGVRVQPARFSKPSRGDFPPLSAVPRWNTIRRTSFSGDRFRSLSPLPGPMCRAVPCRHVTSQHAAVAGKIAPHSGGMSSWQRHRPAGLDGFHRKPIPPLPIPPFVH